MRWKILQEKLTSFMSSANTISSNVKVFWSFVSDLRRKSSIPSEMNFCDSVSSHPGTMCNMFSTFFSSVYAPADNGSPLTKAYDTPFTFSEVSVTAEANYKRLRALDASKGYCPDNITPGVLKH
ncbi:hypothetical protein J6590_100917 [Homalodisca vitripennis]|nr:hypothetical protein J6590_100917 [Homalodisca vitripennis]